MQPHTDYPTHATRRPRAARLYSEPQEHDSDGRGERLAPPPVSIARAPRPSAPRWLRFLVLAVVCALGVPHQASAAPGDWSVSCPNDSSGEPRFLDWYGNLVPILDLQQRAIAMKACNPKLAGAANVNVSVTNNGASTIYVAFTNYSTQMPGPITWASNCVVVNSQVTIPQGTTCGASVPATAGISRFCASTSLVPSGQSPNCNLAQTHNQTMVETNFGTGATSCYPTSLSSCVWYDISVIPQNCTPQAWAANNCQNTGGASYNLPVQLACANQPTYTCKGPPSSLPYGNANYPSNCGNPVANCTGNSPSCDNAYFWPTPSPAPNAECQPGQTLQVTFLAGS